jgi:hypothetical protein
MVAEGDVKLISPEEFHSRKTHQILQRWEYRAGDDRQHDAAGLRQGSNLRYTGG